MIKTYYKYRDFKLKLLAPVTARVELVGTYGKYIQTNIIGYTTYIPKDVADLLDRCLFTNQKNTGFVSAKGKVYKQQTGPYRSTIDIRLLLKNHFPALKSKDITTLLNTARINLNIGPSYRYCSTVKRRVHQISGNQSQYDKICTAIGDYNLKTNNVTG